MLEQVKLRTGLKVRILSNSEQRFLYYKAMSATDNFFEKVANEETVILDVGAGSIQITLMSEGVLKYTQNIDLLHQKDLPLFTNPNFRQPKPS